MGLSDFMTGLVLMSMFVAGSSAMLINLQSDYASMGAANITEFNDTYDKMGDIKEDMDEISDIISEEKMSPTDYLGYITIPFRGMQIVMDSIGLTKGMMDEYTADYDIPTWFSWGIGIILVITIIFIILGSLKRGGNL